MFNLLSFINIIIYIFIIIIYYAAYVCLVKRNFKKRRRLKRLFLKSRESLSVILKNFDKYNFNIKVQDFSLYTTPTHSIIYFLRKNRVFNKGRYSRNRQTCKMAFYFALSIHCMGVTGLFMWYYNLLIKFTYMWYVFLVWISVGVISSIFRYRLYSTTLFYNNIYSFSNWLLSIINFLFSDIFKILDINGIISSIFNYIYLRIYIY